MHYPKPVLTTEPEGDGVRVTARYETPETARMIESLRALAAGAIGLALLVLGIGVHGRTFADWLSGPAILSAALIVIISVFAAKIAAQRLYRHRFFLRGVMDARLDVIVSRSSVKHESKSYDRTQVLRFTAAAHRQGRHEERSERVKERLLSTTYREAWQVWLQSGEDFVLLAEVSDEQGAQAIVRRFQVEDESVTQSVGENAYGRRHQPS
jgi:hypothetical protein